MAKFSFKGEPISKFVVPQSYLEEHEGGFDAAMNFLVDYVKGWNIYNILQFSESHPIKQYWGELEDESGKGIFGFYLEIGLESVKVELYPI